MFSTSAAAVTVLCLTGALIVTSSSWTYFTKRLSIGETAAISFTTIENRVGPNTVPWGTLLLMTTNAVTALSTTTLCFRLSRKLIIQLIICGLMFVDFSLSQIILWDTGSNGLLQSKDNKRTKSESRSNADGQKCWHFNPFPSKWVLRALIDFTLSNARRFYSSMGNLLDRKGLRGLE